MKPFLIILLCCMGNLAIFAQTSQSTIASRNAIYVDMPTINSIGTLSYDRIWYYKNLFAWSQRIGIGSNFHYSTDISIPIETALLIGKRMNYAEIGLGTTATFLRSSHQIAEWSGNKAQEYWFMGRLGYRLQTKHFILRTAYVPYRLLHTTWTAPSIDRKSVHGVSMSIGFAF
ncbi:MAG TPA: hypothetical protein PKH93_14400 [Chitinophagales bacterium]|nr:hypothetical protein [Chitinophagales bacterium]HNL08765.1 hypothetical protein [Chitinophagales bacterium]